MYRGTTVSPWNFAPRTLQGSWSLKSYRKPSLRHQSTCPFDKYNKDLVFFQKKMERNASMLRVPFSPGYTKYRARATSLATSLRALAAKFVLEEMPRYRQWASTSRNLFHGDVHSKFVTWWCNVIATSEVPSNQRIREKKTQWCTPESLWHLSDWTRYAKQTIDRLR